MKGLIKIILISMLITAIAGCARGTRIANDIDWIVFDGEPDVEN